MRTFRPTRRDLLRLAFAGTAGMTLGATSACRPRFEPGELALDRVLDRLDGEMVGANASAGHRLRDGGLPLEAPSEVREAPVVVLGAGIAGLSAAWKLVRSGFSDVEVLELEARAGGKSVWGESSATAFPWGAHYLPTPTRESTAVQELLTEMGLVVDGEGEMGYDRRHLCHAPQERYFADNAWHWGLSAADLLGGKDPTAHRELGAFEARMATWSGQRSLEGRPLFALPMELSAALDELRELDGISMRQWLDQAGWSDHRLRWYLDYCCRDDYGCTLETTSAWAGWHYFCARPPEVENLTWPEGNGRIVRHLLDILGDRVRCGQLVYRVRPLGQAALGEVSEGAEVDVLDLASERPVRIRARRVIFALPRFLAPRLVPGYTFPGLESFTYSPWLVANLSVRRPPDGAAWDNVLVNSRSLGYVVATHQDLRMAPGPSVLTYYLPLTDRDPSAARRELMRHGWAEWTSRILADLAGAHPELLEQVTRVDLMRWGHAMIRPVPGFLTGAARRLSVEPWGPVRFAHSDMSGLSLFEEAQFRGVVAAEAVLSELGVPFASSLGQAQGSTQRA